MEITNRTVLRLVTYFNQLAEVCLLNETHRNRGHTFNNSISSFYVPSSTFHFNRSLGSCDPVILHLGCLILRFFFTWGFRLSQEPDTSWLCQQCFYPQLLSFLHGERGFFCAWPLKRQFFCFHSHLLCIICVTTAGSFPEKTAFSFSC